MTSALDRLSLAASGMEQNKVERDQLIVQARRDGHTWAAIANAAGLTRVGVNDIAKRANGGELPIPELYARPLQITGQDATQND